jgi:hypothetical protein
MVQLRPGRRTVPEAEADLNRARTRLEHTMRAVSSAESMAERVEPRLGPAIKTAGQPLIREAEHDYIKAAVDVEITRTVAAAVHCLKTYDDYTEAQRALAALSLAGLKGLRLRPKEQSEMKAGQRVYDLMVPQEAAATGLAVIRDNPVSEVRSFADGADALRTVEKLRKDGLRATVRPLNPHWHAVYVLQADEEAAREFLSAH